MYNFAYMLINCYLRKWLEQLTYLTTLRLALIINEYQFIAISLFITYTLITNDLNINRIRLI